MTSPVSSPIQSLVNMPLLEHLRNQHRLGLLDRRGEEILNTMETVFAQQEVQLGIAKDNANEIEVISKQIETETVKAEVAAFNASGSAPVMYNAIHTPGYITIQTIPQVNTAVANYNTMVANIVRTHPNALTDPAQVAQLPFNRVDIFSLGRQTKACVDPDVIAQKSEDVLELEEVVSEYEVELKKKYGENVDMTQVKSIHLESIRSEQLEAVKRGERQEAIRDMLDVKGEADRVDGKLPPAVHKSKDHNPAKETGTVSF